MNEPESTAPMPVSKVRLRFAKMDDLRFLSHHDLMRLMERLLRRASLPLRFTSGFHPKPKIVFASALGLGIIGRQEVVEIEFAGHVSHDDVLRQLSLLAPEGLTFLSATNIPPQHNAQPHQALYWLPLSSDAFPNLADAIRSILERDELVVERIRHVPARSAHMEPLGEEHLDAITRVPSIPEHVESKKINLRPFLHRLWRDVRGLWMELGITNQGAARPEEVLRLLGLESYWQDGEAVLERISLSLAEEASHLCAPPASPRETSRRDALARASDLPPPAAALLPAPVLAGAD